MNQLDQVLTEIAARVADLVVERLRAGAPGMLDQAVSPLGKRRHCSAVRRRVARGEPGAAIVGRRHLLSPEALSEELSRVSKRENTIPIDGKAQASGVRTQLENELRLLRGGKSASG